MEAKTLLPAPTKVPCGDDASLFSLSQPDVSDSDTEVTVGWDIESPFMGQGVEVCEVRYGIVDSTSIRTKTVTLTTPSQSTFFLSVEYYC